MRRPPMRCGLDSCHTLHANNWCAAMRSTVLSYLSTSSVLVSPPTDPLASPVEGDCWILGLVPNKAGYSTISVSPRTSLRAHRVALICSSGPLSDDLVVDHLCRVRRCVNPAHLEPVTQAENIRRGATPFGRLRDICPAGHDLTDPANIYSLRPNRRECIPCARRRALERKARLRLSPADRNGPRASGSQVRDRSSRRESA